MNEKFTLMHGDTPVLHADYETRVFKVFKEDLIPDGVREHFVRVRKIREEAWNGNTMNKILNVIPFQKMSLDRWLASRADSSSSFVSSIISLEATKNGFSLEKDKVEIAFMFRAVSIRDMYWVKLDGDNLTFEEVSLHDNTIGMVLARLIGEQKC